MIRNSIEKWLSSVFQLPIVEDFDQTKVENEITYYLDSDIKQRLQNDYITFDFEFKIIMRCPNGFAGIGFLTASLYEMDKRVDCLKLVSMSSGEKIEYMSKTEMIISKSMHAIVKIEYNKIREQIKEVRLNIGVVQ